MADDSYDNGGSLAPGVCVAVNLTDAPEPVLTPEQWARFLDEEPC